MKKISIVITVFNEEKNVALLNERIHLALTMQPFNYEIIFVDDGSTDNTAWFLKEMNDCRVKIIELKKNYGQCPALKAGIDYATGDYIATMDGDLQNDPRDLVRMFFILETGAFDFVTGIRNQRNDKLFFRIIPSLMANWLIRKVTNTEITDNGCGIRLFKSQIIKEMPLYGEFHRFISVLAIYEGARPFQIPVNHFPRMSGRSKYGLSRILKVLSDLILLRFYRKYSQKPMHFFGRMGFLTSVSGAGILFYLLVEKILGKDIWGRPILFLGVLLVIIGFQIILSGIVLDYLMRTYYESQQKKPYTIKNMNFGQKENSKNISILA